MAKRGPVPACQPSKVHAGGRNVTGVSISFITAAYIESPDTWLNVAVRQFLISFWGCRSYVFEMIAFFSVHFGLNGLFLLWLPLQCDSVTILFILPALGNRFISYWSKSLVLARSLLRYWNRAGPRYSAISRIGSSVAASRRHYRHRRQLEASL